MSDEEFNATAWTDRAYKEAMGLDPLPCAFCDSPDGRKWHRRSCVEVAIDAQRLAMAMHRVRNHNGSDELHVLVPHPHALDTSLAEAILVEYNSPEEE